MLNTDKRPNPSAPVVLFDFDIDQPEFVDREYHACGDGGDGGGGGFVSPGGPNGTPGGTIGVRF